MHLQNHLHADGSMYVMCICMFILILHIYMYIVFVCIKLHIHTDSQIIFTSEKKTADTINFKLRILRQAHLDEGMF